MVSIVSTIREKWLLLHQRFGSRFLLIIFAGLFLFTIILLVLSFWVFRPPADFGQLPAVVPSVTPATSDGGLTLPDKTSKYTITGLSSDTGTDRLPVYKVSSGLSLPVAQNAAKVLGFSPDSYQEENGLITWRSASGDDLRVYIDSGFFSYKIGDFSKLTVGTISEDEPFLRSKAREHLFNVGLLDSAKDPALVFTRSSYLAGVGHTFPVANSKEALLAELCFTYQPVAGRTVLFSSYDPCSIRVWLAELDAKLVSVKWLVPDRVLGQKSEYSVISLDEAWRQVTSGKAWVAYFSQYSPEAEKLEWGEFYAFNPDQFDSVVIEEAKLGYISGSKDDERLLVPVWVFSGKAVVTGKSDPYYLKLYVQAS